MYRYHSVIYDVVLVYHSLTPTFPYLFNVLLVVATSQKFNQLSLLA